MILNDVGRGRREGRGGIKHSTQEAKGAKGTKKKKKKKKGGGKQRKMFGLCREVNRGVGPGGGEFRVEGRVCQSYPVMGRD